MHLSTVTAILAMGPPPQPNQPQPPFWATGVVPFVLIGIIFYFVLFRPQQKKSRELAELLKSVKAGDKILTSGGMIAVVVTVKDKSLTVRSADSKFEITRSSVAEITERSGETTQS